MTSIVVTHDMKTAFSLSDRLAMNHRGEIVCVGTPDELRRSEDPRVVAFLGGEAPANEDVATLLTA